MRLEYRLHRHGRRLRVLIAVVGASVLATGTSETPREVHALSGIQLIQHVVIVMQENRSFDSYFGTYPGANGPPAGSCVPDPLTGICVKPYHDSKDANIGGPHGQSDTVTDLDGGKMDGFIRSVYQHRGQTSCSPVPATGSCTDAMGYHDSSEIPNYWSYAQSYVLHDAMFESSNDFSNPSHQFLVSGWSASCKDPAKPMTCSTTGGSDHNDGGLASSDCDDTKTPCKPPDYAWTDLTYLLHKAKVSWAFYKGTSGPEFWWPLADFATVHEDNQLGNIRDVSKFFSAAAAGTLPAVSWIAPGSPVSEHPAAKVSAGQAYVTSLVDAVMRGPDWSSTAIFVAWDDWGGFYDHVVPPVLDGAGAGLRVPSLLISPYAKRGFVDHQTLTFDNYLKFIEDDFLAGKRIDPATDGRPDSRPNVRENSASLGNLVNDFDFSLPPRPPKILPVDWSALSRAAKAPLPELTFTANSDDSS